MLSAEHLRSILDYNAETGEFRFKHDPRKKPNINSRDTKRPAGSIGVNGRRAIKIGGRRYYCNRLAWLFVYGRWPHDQIDHINGDRLDDRIANLREATPQQNNYNVGITSRNRSGHKGVHWNSRYRKWQADIRVAGKKRFLGRFDDIETATAAYERAATDLHAEFARVPPPVPPFRLIGELSDQIVKGLAKRTQSCAANEPSGQGERE